jgi:hypothetical protein
MTKLDGERVLVLGDTNGRFGELPSTTFKMIDDAHAADVMVETEYKRRSVDKKVEKRGKEIVQLMDTANVIILNGVNSEPMEWTYVGPLG